MIKKRLLFLLSLFFMLTSCKENQSIINFIEEREANEILVFLAAHGIEAQKIKAQTAQVGAAGGAPTNLWNIMVDPKDSIEAMALLNKQGLPRKKGATLLELFAKEGLMSSDKEENIRYQAGQEEELKNIIRKIDGVIDADVQISFPSTEALPGAAPLKVKAAVYIKHQGVFDDPNNHLDAKIKRLLAGSVENLDFEDVSVISDKSVLTDVELTPEEDAIYTKARGKEYISIWSIIMTRGSSSKFRMLFFALISIILVFGGIIAWLIYKYYPILKREKTKK